MIEDRTVDEELWELILKYKQSLMRRAYPPVGEREADRRILHGRYEELHTLQQKLLDTRAYLGLGRVQGAVNKKMLADDITPGERLRMLARVVRMLFTPVVFLPGSGTVSLARFTDHGARDLADGATRRAIAPEPPPLRVRTRAPSDDDRLRRTRGRLLERLARPLSPRALQEELDHDEAELLSQIASRKDCRLIWGRAGLRLERCDPEQPVELERVAVVLKGGEAR